MTSLNPLRTIGYHLIEVIRRHQKMSKSCANNCHCGVEQGRDPLPEQRMKQYPHELSGDAAAGHDRYGTVGTAEVADCR